MFRMGAYRHRGQNKPRGADRTPDDAWTMPRLAAMGMEVRNSFEDVCYLRQVHRYAEEREGVPPELREECRRDAARFLQVTRGMADCDPDRFSKEDHAWLSRRCRSILQQTEEGRRELLRFDGGGGAGPAPLLMGTRKDTVAGKVNVATAVRPHHLGA